MTYISLLVAMKCLKALQLNLMKVMLFVSSDLQVQVNQLFLEHLMG